MVLDEQQTPPHARSLRSELEMHRLEHRARRMAFVISALKAREEAYERRGTVPRPLHDAIAGFAAELRHDRQRLRELRSGR
jgi:hypothetical protein